VLFFVFIIEHNENFLTKRFQQESSGLRMYITVWGFNSSETKKGEVTLDKIQSLSTKRTYIAK